MANFNTHFAAGSFASGMAASLCFFGGVCNLGMSIGLWAAGAIGSLLPDIDADYPPVLKALFNGLAFVVMGLTMYWLSAQSWGILASWLFLGLVYFLIRFPLMMYFQKFTKHRGAFHSVLGAVEVGLVAALLGYYTLGLTPFDSWMLAVFTGGGFLVHLVLDEVIHVDILNNKLQPSFGTALKIFSVERYGRSAIMAVAVGIMMWFAPPLNITWETLENIANKVDPKWFDEEYLRTYVDTQIDLVQSYVDELKSYVPFINTGTESSPPPSS